MPEAQLLSQWKNIVDAGIVAMVVTLVALFVVAGIFFMRMWSKFSDNQTKHLEAQEANNTKFIEALGRAQVTRESLNVVLDNQSAIIQSQAEQMRIFMQQPELIKQLNIAVDQFNKTIIVMQEQQLSSNQFMIDVKKDQDEGFKGVNRKLQNMTDNDGKILAELQDMNASLKAALVKINDTMDAIQRAMEHLSRLENHPTLPGKPKPGDTPDAPT